MNPQKDKGGEIKFEDQKIEIQEYMTFDGFKIIVKPIITKILKHDKYNNHGKPTYNTVLQAITNIEKIKNTGFSCLENRSNNILHETEQFILLRTFYMHIR